MLVFGACRRRRGMAALATGWAALLSLRPNRRFVAQKSGTGLVRRLVAFDVEMLGRQ